MGCVHKMNILDQWVWKGADQSEYMVREAYKTLKRASCRKKDVFEKTLNF